MRFAVALCLALMSGLSAEDSVSDRFSLLDVVPLDHNRPKLLTEEVNSFEIQKVLLKQPLLTTVPAFLSKLRLEVVSDFLELIPVVEKDKSENEADGWLQMDIGGVKLQWPSAEDKERVPKSYQDALNDYLKIRLSGHSKAYAIASIQKRGLRHAVADLSLLMLLRRHPDVPYSWVKRTTRTISPRPQSQDTEYLVVDGPVAWVFTVHTQQSIVDVERLDAQAIDETLAPKFNEADKEAQPRLEQRGIKPKLGYVHAYWPELEKVLKEKFGLTWYSPDQLNPSRTYD